MFIFDWRFVIAAVVFLNLRQDWFREVYFCGIECVHNRRLRHGLSLVCLLFACLLMPVYLHFTFPLPLPVQPTILICLMEALNPI